LAEGSPIKPAVAGIAALAIFAFCLLPEVTRAQDDPAIFKDADLALGEELIAEKACAACHSRKVGGDGSAIYNPGGRINSPGFLRGMVEQCNSELGLALFPEEVTDIAAVLNRDHYHFTDTAK